MDGLTNISSYDKMGKTTLRTAGAAKIKEELMNNAQNAEIRTIEESVIWEDRKHHLWFPLSFTRYSIGNGRLYINSGFLSSREDECLLYRITDIALTRTLGQRIFGTGTIELHTKDTTTPVIRLENIGRSVEIKRMLSNMVEKEREEKQVVGRDMYGASSHINCSGHHDELEDGREF